MNLGSSVVLPLGASILLLYLSSLWPDEFGRVLCKLTGDGCVPLPAFSSDQDHHIKLYGLKMSTCTRRVLLALEEKGLSYTLETIDLASGQQKTPEFLKLQPFGVVPVLEHGALRIFESRAIVRYIATRFRYEGTDLLGSTPEARALTDTWLEVESQNFHPAASGIVSERVFKKRRGLESDESKVTEYLVKLDAVMAIYEQQLQGSDYLSGAKAVTLADLSHIPYMQHLFNCNASSAISSRPRVMAWWNRITSRSSWQKIVAL